MSQIVKSENTNNKCNVRNTLNMIYFCSHKSPVANWAKRKTGFSAGTKVVMNILLLGNGIYIKESICWVGSHTWFSFIPTCFYCELLGTVRWIITVSSEWSYQITDLLTSSLGHLWGFSAAVRPNWALFHPCPGTPPPCSLSVSSESLHSSL